MKIFEILDYGFRIGRLEIYYIKTATGSLKERFQSIGRIEAHCGCKFLDLAFIGFTWTGPNYTCQGGSDAEQ